jgi:hypothetical protein
MCVVAHVCPECSASSVAALRLEEYRRYTPLKNVAGLSLESALTVA